MSSPGDVLGFESCIDLRSSDDNAYTESLSNSGHRSYTPAKAMKKKQRGREYPPPLPSLGLEMKRYRTVDGRLIIREEKTSRRRHHDIFRADRSNGRLTLHFLHSDDENDAALDEPVFQMDVRNDDEIRSTSSSSSSSSLHS